MGNGVNGYPQRCRNCTGMIWIQLCNDNRWKPFDFPDKTLTGNWELHDCPRRSL